MRDGWRIARLGDLLSETNERAGTRTDLPVLSVTKNRGVMLASERFGKPLHGLNLAKYRLARRGQLAVDPMLLWDGSLGLQGVVDAGLVSPDYRMFDAVTGVDPRFLEALLRSDVMRPHFQSGARGTNVRRNRIARGDFLAIRTAVPSLDEQRRIAAILSATDATLEAAERCVSDAAAVCRALADDFVMSSTHEWLPLEDVLADGPTNGKSPAARAVPPGVPTFSIAAVRNGTVSIREHLKFADVAPESVAGAAVSLGDVLVVRGNANPSLIAACGMVREEPPTGCIYPDILMRVRPDLGKLDPEFLVTVWNSSVVHADLLLRAKTTTGTFKVNGRDVAKTRIPVPTLSEQRRLVTLVRVTRERAEADREVLRRMRATKKALAHNLLGGA